MKRFSSQENFYKRLRELGRVDEAVTSPTLNTLTLVEYVRANDGSALGIINENDSFYIKSSNVKGDKLTAADFTYIGGLENKLRYKYGSLSEAIKTRNYYINNLNESLGRNFKVAKTLNEEKILGAQDLVADSNADKGGIANAQDVADKAKSGEQLKKDAKEHDPAEAHNKDGIANAQSTADANKSDDAGAKLKAEKEASTATGAARPDIAKAQTHGDAESPDKAQGEADKHKKDIPLKKEEPKEVKPASDAKKETAIVVEHFGKSDGEVSLNPMGSEVASEPASADPMGMGGMGAADSSPESDINAAAAALDNLDMSSDEPSAVSAPSMGGDSDMGVSSDDLASLGGDDMGMGGDEGGLKDLQKLVGKVGQKASSMGLEPEMAAGLLKQVLAGFKGSLADLDSEAKKMLANEILKAGEEENPMDSMGGGLEGGEKSPEASSEPDSAPAPEPKAEKPDFGGAEKGGEENDGGEEEKEPEDAEIKEAINSHLQKLAANMGADKAPAKTPADSSDTKPFKAYMNERGYTDESISECSIMEMASLVSGYANECEGMYENADFQTIAEYMSPEVKEAVTEAGHADFAKRVDPFIDKPKKFVSETPSVKLDEYGDEHAMSTADAVGAMKGKVAESAVEESTVEEEKAKVEEAKKKVGFAAGAESLNKKEEDEAKKVEETKAVEEKQKVEESVKKLKSIIHNKIQEQLGLKKKSLNEAAKSALSKKIDLMISEEIKKNKDFLKKFNIK